MSKTTTDPIADMLSRIRNAIAVNRNEISLPHSKVKEAIARLLSKNHYIESVEVEEASVGEILKITINQPHTSARITDIRRVSTPGRRQYSTSEKIPTVMRGRGIIIVSTSKGIMTGLDAKRQGIGGELICKVY